MSVYGLGVLPVLFSGGRMAVRSDMQFVERLTDERVLAKTQESGQFDRWKSVVLDRLRSKVCERLTALVPSCLFLSVL